MAPKKRNKAAKSKLEKKENNSDKVSLELDQWVRRMRCNGFNKKGIRLQQFKDVQVGVLDEETKFGSHSYEPYPDMKIENFVYQGGRDGENRFHGSDSLLFEEGTSTMIGTWDHGLREGFFKIVTNRNGVQYVEGDYMNDNMNGKLKIIFDDNTWIEGFFKDGILHGFCRYFDAKNRLTFVGMHRNGKPVGTCWSIVGGGGCVVGRVDKKGKLSGPDIAYIYPDFKTALVGQFEDGIMISAQQCSVINVITEMESILAVTFSEPKGTIFKREVSGNDNITSMPNLKDPYETNTIQVRKSSVEGASEGIFTKCDIQKNTILAFYNGIKLPSNYEEPDSWDENAYKIFDPSNVPDGALDILEEHRSTAHYSASLAHKANHSFLPNSQFLVYDHPRWGIVPCIASTCHIEADQEIFVRYGYDLDWCPDWYQEAWNSGNYEPLVPKNSYFTLDEHDEYLPDEIIV
eukprot:GFUD01023548.1.p1 GENE.GFUD01023548.1~~GFUD01023548.1.p1  ORF type:complete len:461 (+),score=107.13 GFUD01023548.1:170-1552(+)